MKEDEETEARNKMHSVIVETLEKFPYLGGYASQAISIGLEKANNKAVKELSEVRLALALSLALLPPNRINEESKNLFNKLIVQALPNKNRTKSEQAFVDRHLQS